ETRRFSTPLSFVGSRYDYRERFVRELADAPLRLWGAGWGRTPDPVVRGLVAGGPVFGHDKLCVYSGSTISLNHHHPMNDIVGVNTRTFELAASGACQVVDAKDELSPLFKPGDELLVYRDLGELRRLLDHFLARPEEARAIGENARRRALAEHTLSHRVDEMLAALLDCPRLAKRLGVRSLAIKFEGANPTGTVKDRSSATGVAAALQFGFTATSVVSSGNAGSSIAAYSARAGLRSLIFAYARASAPKLLHMAATTADLVLYEGVYDDLIAHWDRLVESRLFFDCGASRNAYKH